ncbi:VCBS repeat-containing protein [Vitiosangium sp. GDMCC 1.1324]|uniref:FG-GAP repeat domain-containing protein n=1 Tax=Vitiosangium sp. (strain GDMCC 1.1324) TaxID=2138576 RepID=UPI00130ECEAD|nr:VCBS repeat-containing protein [Vitiosangium sp. GDMCC 1.1324]
MAGLASALVGVMGCGVEPTPAPETPVTTPTDLGQSQQDLMGNIVYGTDCSTGMQSFLGDVMRYGRVAAASTAFEQCVDQRLTERYKKCNGDPFYSDTLDTQKAQVLWVARSANAVKMNCTGGGGNASTGIGSYGHTDNEEFWWGGWLTSVYNSLGWPVCNGTNGPNCRFAAAPWPYSQAAGISWHEVMHTHGYTHGANDQANAKVACGYGTLSDSQWHFQYNTMPYIIGDCLGEVIDRSGQRCGNVDSCGANALRIVDGFDSTTCSCQYDPRPTALGMVDIRGEGHVDAKMVEGERIPVGWLYANDNQTGWVGDFNGDNRDDFVIRSPWGLGLVAHDGSGMSMLAGYSYGTWLGSWQLGSADRIEAVVDLNGDGRDELVLRNANGLGVLYLNTSGSVTTMHVVNYGTRLTGGWLLGSGDELKVKGDFDGDGREDLLLRSAWGMAILRRNNSTGQLETVNMSAYGTSLGGWVLASTDAVWGVGDFDGNGRAELVLRSTSGLGLLTRDSTGALYPMHQFPFGTWLGNWNFGSDNTAPAFADFNGDGRTDMVLRSPWGWGIISRSSTGSLYDLAMLQHGSWAGYWHISNDNTVLGARDLTGNGRAELVLSSPWGIGALQYYSGYGLWSELTVPYNGLVSSWIISPNGVQAMGDFDGDGASELLMKKY